MAILEPPAELLDLEDEHCQAHQDQASPESWTGICCKELTYRFGHIGPFLNVPDMYLSVYVST